MGFIKNTKDYVEVDSRYFNILGSKVRLNKELLKKDCKKVVHKAKNTVDNVIYSAPVLDAVKTGKKVGLIAVAKYKFAKIKAIKAALKAVQTAKERLEDAEC